MVEIFFAVRPLPPALSPLPPLLCGGGFILPGGAAGYVSVSCIAKWRCVVEVGVVGFDMVKRQYSKRSGGGSASGVGNSQDEDSDRSSGVNSDGDRSCVDGGRVVLKVEASRMSLLVLSNYSLILP